MRAKLSFAIAAVGILLLSGCISTQANEPTAKSVDEPIKVAGQEAASLAFDAEGLAIGDQPGLISARGEARYTGFNAFEPTIGVTETGAIFVTSFGGGAHISRSTDGGASWERVTGSLGPLNNPPNSNDPYVWVDQDTGRVFTNDLQALVCSWMNYSDDEGETWVSNPIGCGLPPGVHDHQTIGTSVPRTVPTVGYPNVVYYCVNRVADSVCSTSLNGGLTFGPLIPVYAGLDPSKGSTSGSPLSGFCGGLHGHVKSAPDGTTYLPKGQCGVAMVSKTVDDGVTWTNHVIDQTVGAQGHEVAVAIDAMNNVYALWMGSDGIPYLSTSIDAAETWSPPIRVAPPTVTATDFPAIAAGDAGRIAFAYAGTDVANGYDTSDMGNAEWHAYVAVITNALDANPSIQTVTANPLADPVAVGTCGRARCPGIGDFIDITIDFQGRPWAVFGDGYVDGATTGTIGAGFVGTLTVGPALRGDLMPLPALPELATAAGDS